MPEDRDQPPGLNILCIDGGGARGLSSLVVLKEVMHRLQDLEQNNKELIPADHFDFIAGISACMLGRLRMPITKAIEAYGKLMKDVFTDRKVLGSTAFKGRKLQQALRSMIREAAGNEGEMMLEDLNQGGEEKCKTAVFAMARKNMNSCLPVMFRSYRAVANPGPNCTIWEALYATMAHPDLFKSIEILDSSIRQSFVGGEIGCSNPIAHVLAEVKKQYPGRHIACILSIGAGHARTIQVPDPNIIQRMFRTQDVVVMKQMATDSERLADEMATRFQDTSGGYFRFNVDQGMQTVLASSWERLDEISAHTGAYLRKPGISTMMEQVGKSIKERQHAIPTEYIDGHIPGKPMQQSTNLRRCPAPTPVYTGRLDESAQVEACITGGNSERRICVVCGLGGVGKTQLVLSVIERTRDKWDHLIYVDASSKETIEKTLSDFSLFKSIGNTYEAAVSWLESCKEQWLVVFDNADDPSVPIRHYIPGGHHGSIIITTRLTDLKILAKGPGSTCHLSKMSQEDGLALLIRTARLEDEKLSDNDVQAAISLLQDFDYFALAIVHAGAYMGHVQSISIAKYRDLFLSKRRHTLERSGRLQGTIDDYGKTVYTTWNMCYELLKEHSRPILWLMAFLHHDGISEDIFMRAASNLNSPTAAAGTDAGNHVKRILSSFLDAEGVWDSMRFADVMAELTSCSLVDLDRMNLIYNVHILVQDWVSTVIPQPSRFAMECTATLLSLSIDEFGDADALAFQRRLVQHVSSLLEHKPRLKLYHLWDFAIVYMEAGQWRFSQSLKAAIFDICKTYFGSEHPLTLNSMSSLVATYSVLGQQNEALELGAQLVEISKRVLGEEHPTTLAGVGNLVASYLDLGCWDEAMRLMEHVLGVQKRLMGEEDEHTACYMGGLAAVYLHLGRGKEAEKIQAPALKILTRTLGETHPKTLAAMHNLGSIYALLDRQNEAEKLMTRTVDACKRVLGAEHPNTLISMIKLSSLHSNMGRLGEAEEMQIKVLNGLKESLGEDHPDTLKAMYCLASTYSRLGQLSEVEKLRVQVLNIRREVLGKRLFTMQGMQNLTSLYLRGDRWGDEQPLLNAIMVIPGFQLGSHHPTTPGADNSMPPHYPGTNPNA